MMNFFERVRDWFLRHHLWVIADASDNSVTLSKALFKHMRVMDQDQAKVLVFRVGEEYGFTLNPELEQGDAPLADVQYNEKYRSIGFESLNPTVNRIFYDYGLPPLAKAKLTVKPQRTLNMQYYVICRPDGETA